LILEKYALSEDINLLIQDKEMFLDFPEIRENVEARIADFYSKLNIDAVMCEVLERGASLANTEFLKRQTVEDYVQWLQKDIPDLVEIIRECLKMEAPISENIRAAIKKLASSSSLSTMRAKSLYEIEIDNSGSTLVCVC
jgi:hypothetical protein